MAQFAEIFHLKVVTSSRMHHSNSTYATDLTCAVADPGYIPEEVRQPIRSIENMKMKEIGTRVAHILSAPESPPSPRIRQ